MCAYGEYVQWEDLSIFVDLADRSGHSHVWKHDTVARISNDQKNVATFHQRKRIDDDYDE